MSAGAMACRCDGCGVEHYLAEPGTRHQLELGACGVWRAKLKCSGCGTRSVGTDLQIVAKLGGTHYVRHRTDNRGRHGEAFYRASSCGTWERA